MYLHLLNGRRLFTAIDPRDTGYAGHVDTVDLDYDLEAVHRWPINSERPMQCLGEHPKSKGNFKVFRTEKECRDAGYVCLGTDFEVRP